MNEMNTEEKSTLIKMTKFEKTLTTILTCILIAYGMSFRYQGQTEPTVSKLYKNENLFDGYHYKNK